MTKKFSNIKIILLIVFLMTTSIIKVNAKEELEDPYIDISFDIEAKENKNHGTLQVFKNEEEGLYANKSISFGINEFGTYMKWVANKSRGGGFNLNIDKTIGENYTIALKFSFTNTGEITGGWKKIIDFQSTIQPDSGFYFYNKGQIQFYPQPSQGPFIKNDEVVDLLIRRNGTTKKFEVYNRVGNESILCYEFTDTNGLSILSSSLGFFHDDYATSSEASNGGKVFSVKIWDFYADVDDVWEALDKERENSISRYICRQIEGQEPTEFTSGWKTYYECKNKEDNSYKYFEEFDEENYSGEITDITKWKEESGYIPQTKDITDIITDLKNQIKDITKENVKSSDKNNIENITDTISKINIKKITKEETNSLKEIDDKCNLFLDKIEETSDKLKEVKNAVDKYSNKKLIEKDKEDIKNEILKAKNISTNNLIEFEQNELLSYIEILENILNGNIENPKTLDNIYIYLSICIISLLGLTIVIHYNKKRRKI